MSHQSLILTKKSAKDLSKLQKQFNANVRKIEELKGNVVAEKEMLRRILTRIQAEIVPLERKHNDQLIELVFVFDRHYDNPFFKKKEQAKMAEFIIDRTVELIENLGMDNLKPLYEKYANRSYDEVNAQADNITADFMKNMIASKYGIEIDDDADLSNPQKIQEYIALKLEEKESESHFQNPPKEKTAKQIEKEEKLKQEAKNISKVARSIYTDLVKAFHPDREQDETERERKTEIMKLVTQAYEKDDLFELLRLKIELQNSDIESITMADEQLKYYNKILKEQVAELERNLLEVRRQASTSMQDTNLFTKFGGDEKTMKIKFSYEINRLKRNTKELEQNIVVLRGQESMRRFLKDFDNDFYN